MAGRCCCKTKPVIVASVSASTGPSTRRPTAAADAPPSPLSVRACRDKDEEKSGMKTNTISVRWKYEAGKIVGLGSHRHGGGGLEARFLSGHHVAQRLQQLLVHHL